ncbi:MAG: hypothetical protein RJB66_2396 [Pseudomonadota bacterium]|jgi:hypothetical protein
MDQWLPVLDYAVNNRVSVSTLRRRIKSQTVEYKLEQGRYLIRTEFHPEGSDVLSGSASADSIMVVQGLVSELKKAYGLVLAEKEELIQQLRSEIETLRNINKFLELQIMNDGRVQSNSQELNY